MRTDDGLPEPKNCSPLPECPATQAVFDSVPLFPLPVASAVVPPLPSLNGHMNGHMPPPEPPPPPPSQVLSIKHRFSEPPAPPTPVPPVLPLLPVRFVSAMHPVMKEALGINTSAATSAPRERGKTVQ